MFDPHSSPGASIGCDIIVNVLSCHNINVNVSEKL